MSPVKKDHRLSKGLARHARSWALQYENAALPHAPADLFGIRVVPVATNNGRQVDILQKQFLVGNLDRGQTSDTGGDDAEAPKQESQDPIVFTVRVDESTRHDGPCQLPLLRGGSYGSPQQYHFLDHATSYGISLGQRQERIKDYTSSQTTTDQGDRTVTLSMADENIRQYDASFTGSLQCHRPGIVHDRRHFDQGLFEKSMNE